MLSRSQHRFAVRIYQGQRMVLGQSSDGPLLREMQVIIRLIVSSSRHQRLQMLMRAPLQAHEEAHLAGITEAAHRHRADPSVLLPIWSAAALALGDTVAGFHHYFVASYSCLS